MIGAFTPLADHLDVEVSAVVSVTWAGRTWRLSSRALSGSDVEIDPGLLEVPDIDDEISLESGGDVGTSATIAFVLPAVSVSTYIAAGYDLIDLTAEVALVWHRRGTLLHGWAARELRAQGDAGDPQWGDPGQPAGWIACSIEDSPYRVQRQISRQTWQVSAQTWPSATAVGARYPLPIGKPDPSGVGGGPPAPVVEENAATLDNETALVSIGWCLASQVKLIDDADPPLSAVLNISYQADGLGQICATVDLIGSGLTVAPGTEYTSAWTKGAAMSPLGGRGALHVAAYLLALGGADLDLAEWARVAELLSLPAGGYVDDPDSEPWEVARELLTGLTVTMRRSREGWAPVLLDPHLAPQLFSETWRDGGPWRRTSAWTQTGDSRVTRVSVLSDASEISAGMTAARDAGLPHAWGRHLPRQQEAGESPSWSWSAITDYRALAWQARIGAFGWEAASYQVPPQWGRARSGDWIYLASDARYALVQRRSLIDGIWDYTLVRPAGR